MTSVPPLGPAEAGVCLAARPCCREESSAQAARAYVLHSAEGETVVRPSGDIVIKVDPTRGAPNIAMGTQHLKAGAHSGPPP